MNNKFLVGFLIGWISAVTFVSLTNDVQPVGWFQKVHQAVEVLIEGEKDG